jgi:DNA-binding response OmpR family regulator
LALADDLESAVAAVEIELPDLALVDIQLARGCSGLDVAAALQVRGVPVLFASGNCPTDRGRDVALGCLQKPITDRVLAAAIHAVAMTLQGATPTSIPSALRLY